MPQSRCDHGYPPHRCTRCRGEQREARRRFLAEKRAATRRLTLEALDRVLERRGKSYQLRVH